MLQKIKETLQNYRRVLMIARKPDKVEFTQSIRISALGMILIGVIGLVFYLIAVLAGL